MLSGSCCQWSLVETVQTLTLRLIWEDGAIWFKESGHPSLEA